MTPIELPIFHHSDETATLKEVGMEYDINDSDIRTVTFYSINAISPYIETDKHGKEHHFSSIHANASEYICPIPYNKLKEKIRKAIEDDRPFT